MSKRVPYQRSQSRLLAMPMLVVIASAFCAAMAGAVEMLSAKQLASYCQALHDEPNSAEGQFCIHYIQGFIDGAVATDTRAMIRAGEDLGGSESFTERAIRTRVPNLADDFRAARPAGFCLGEPLPLRKAIDSVMRDLTALPPGIAATEPARGIVYASLREHYPCQA